MLHEFSYIEPSSHFWNETNMVYNEHAVGFCLCFLGLLVYDFTLSGVDNSGLSGGAGCAPLLVLWKEFQEIGMNSL